MCKRHSTSQNSHTTIHLERLTMILSTSREDSASPLSCSSITVTKSPSIEDEGIPPFPVYGRLVETIAQTNEDNCGPEVLTSRPRADSYQDEKSDAHILDISSRDHDYMNPLDITTLDSDNSELLNSETHNTIASTAGSTDREVSELTIALSDLKSLQTPNELKIKIKDASTALGTPSPSETALKPAATPLVSALRRRSSDEPANRRTPAAIGVKKSRPSTGRRVTGLWNPVVDAASLTFAPSSASRRNAMDVLQDATLEHILSFLSMADWLRCTMVDRRWNYIAQRDSVWKRVDATDFCREAHENFSKSLSCPAKATRATSEELDKFLQRRASKSLEIRSIGKCLSVDWFLPCASSLHELTLGGFEDLNDTHVHVMLLASGQPAVARKSKSGNTLRKLVLEECPLLTNASIRSISKICTNLEELSLKGSGRRHPTQLSDVTPLADLLVTSLDPSVFSMPDISCSKSNKNSNPLFRLGKRPDLPAHTGAPLTPALSLSSLFASPVPAKVAAAPAPSSAKLSTPPQPPMNSLGSLFAPPRPAVQCQQRKQPPTNSLAALFGPPQSVPSKCHSKALSCPHIKKEEPQLPGQQKASAPPEAAKSPQASTQPSPSPSSKRQPQAPPTNSLASLFAEPGTSPKSASGKQPLVLSSLRPCGKLARIDLRETSVSAQAFVSCLQQASNSPSNNGRHLIHLESIAINGYSWTDAYMRQLAGLLSLDDLCELDLSVSFPSARLRAPSTKLTHAGMQALTSSNGLCLSNLQRLNLTGHSQITEAGVTSCFVNKAPRLDSIAV